MNRLALVAALLLLPVAPRPADAASPAARSDSVSAELARAVADYPDDPSLRLALAKELEAEGDLAGAVAQLETVAERWPERGRALWLRIGLLEVERGRDAEAVAPFERAAQEGEDRAAAELHLGLALRRLGRHEEAAASFERAGRNEPGLASEAALLQALSRIDLGDEAGAVSFLERVIELDPEGDAALSAALLLRSDARRERPSYFDVELFGGYELDDNVTLDASTSVPIASDQHNDARAVWGATVTLRPIHTERFGLSLGARYDQAEQEELSAFDTRRELAFASLRFSPHERVSLRLDGLATRTRLDARRYQRTRSLRPSVMVALGERAGVTRWFATLEEISYPEEVSLPNLDRDGHAVGGGFEHFLPVPRFAGTWFSLGADWRRYDTDSERSAPILGSRFGSPYDHDRWRGTASVRSPLLLGFRAEASFSWAQERYEHRNLFDLLTVDPTPRSRMDHVLEGRFALSRPVSRYAEVEVRVQQIERTSNVDIYQYDRRIVGVYLKLHTP